MYFLVPPDTIQIVLETFHSYFCFQISITASVYIRQCEFASSLGVLLIFMSSEPPVCNM